MDNLTPIGKLFFTSLIGWVNSDHKLNWKLKGDPEKMNAFAKIILAVKRFQEETKKPDATIDSIMQKLDEKNQAALDFKNICGFDWPL
jgi:hypothetical protein